MTARPDGPAAKAWLGRCRECYRNVRSLSRVTGSLMAAALDSDAVRPSRWPSRAWQTTSLRGLLHSRSGLGPGRSPRAARGPVTPGIVIAYSPPSPSLDLPLRGAASGPATAAPAARQSSLARVSSEAMGLRTRAPGRAGPVPRAPSLAVGQLKLAISLTESITRLGTVTG